MKYVAEPLSTLNRPRCAPHIVMLVGFICILVAPLNPGVREDEASAASNP